MLVIGLTGGLGTGKTTVAALFSKQGARVIDADKIVHRLIKANKACIREVIKYFGKGILTAGRIDRKKLAGIVFNNTIKLKKLERILHPRVGKEIRSKVSSYGKQKRVKAVVLDVPLLFESGMDKDVDVIIAVKAGREEQIKRTMKHRKLTRSAILSRIRAQMPMNEKLLLADIIIDNRGSIPQTRKQVKEIWRKLASLG